VAERPYIGVLRAKLGETVTIGDTGYGLRHGR
jgi:hypothetical protein